MADPKNRSRFSDDEDVELTEYNDDFTTAWPEDSEEEYRDYGDDDPFNEENAYEDDDCFD